MTDLGLDSGTSQPLGRFPLQTFLTLLYETHYPHYPTLSF